MLKVTRGQGNQHARKTGCLQNLCVRVRRTKPCTTEERCVPDKDCQAGILGQSVQGSEAGGRVEGYIDCFVTLLSLLGPLFDEVSCKTAEGIHIGKTHLTGLSIPFLSWSSLPCAASFSSAPPACYPAIISTFCFSFKLSLGYLA